MSDPIVSFDEAAMRGELRELVRRTVEDTLNALLEEEADDLIGADRYERTAGREAYRAGHYERGLTTTSGQVTLRMSIARREHRPFRCLRSGAHAVREPPVSRLDIAISSLRAASGR